MAPACAVDTGGTATEPSGAFVPEPDDEALDPADPPTDPDPPEATDTASAGQALSNGGAPCKPASALLSPSGLTFAIHVSKHAAKAAAELAHIEKIRHFLRARDVFVIEHGSPVVAKLRQLFPCNRFHILAYPDGMKAALATGNGIDGIEVDWEGSYVVSHSQAWNIGRLSNYRKSIHAHGKRAGFVPSWGTGFDDGAIDHASEMDYELAQIQGACVNGPKHFANRARALLTDFASHGESMRNIGFEISMDSFLAASNHVGPARAAKCTRKAYGKGARAIYIYGNGSDHLVPYFHELGKLGLRTPQ